MGSGTDLFPDGELAEAAELGAVTDRSVRVWGRQPGAAELRVELTVDGCPPITGAVQLSAETDWTGAVSLELPAPAPDSPFTCRVGDRQLEARLAPSSGAREAFTFAFGSCHPPFAVGCAGRIGFNGAEGLYP